MMQEIIKSFPEQIKNAVGLSNNSLTFIPSSPHHIVIAGMGSSNIPGILTQQWLYDSLKLPLMVSHDYVLPAYVNQHTLLIILSYSGNTQEMIANFQIGIANRSSMVIISSGGILQSLASKHHIPFLALPTDLPPRGALAYTITYLLCVLSTFRIFSWDFQKELLAAAGFVKQQQPYLQNIALAVAKKIQGHLPVIYTPICYEGVALRLRQQLNENSKQLCWHHTLPELHHNEVMGWEKITHHLAIIVVRRIKQDERLQKQQDQLEEILEKKCDNITYLEPKGPTLLTQSLYLIHLSDWISLYLAQENSVDPMDIQLIKQIKAVLN